MLASSLDMLTSHNHTSRVLLNPSCGYPTWRVLGIGLDQGVEEHPSTLDIANLGVGLDHNTIQ